MEKYQKVVNWKTIPLGCLFALFGCNEANEVNDTIKNDVIEVTHQDTLEKEDVIIDIETDSTQEINPPCTYDGLQTFQSFLNIDYGTEEHELLHEQLLGQFSGGVYSPDSSAFVYKYHKIPTVPIELWVNTGTGKVETIFVELLSKGDDYQLDMEKFDAQYQVSECDKMLLGKEEGMIKSILGEPDEEAVSKSGITLLGYDDPQGEVSVTLKLYPDQMNVCTSIAVHWFYPSE